VMGEGKQNSYFGHYIWQRQNLFTTKSFSSPFFGFIFFSSSNMLGPYNVLKIRSGLQKARSPSPTPAGYHLLVRMRCVCTNLGQERDQWVTRTTLTYSTKQPPWPRTLSVRGREINKGDDNPPAPPLKSPTVLFISSSLTDSIVT